MSDDDGGAACWACLCCLLVIGAINAALKWMAGWPWETIGYIFGGLMGSSVLLSATSFLYCCIRDRREERRDRQNERDSQQRQDLREQRAHELAMAQALNRNNGERREASALAPVAINLQSPDLIILKRKEASLGTARGKSQARKEWHHQLRQRKKWIQVL